MFARPSARRKTKHSVIEINLVPMLDALVTLIAFLLLAMTFLSVVSIESPVPITSREILDRITTKPLQLTITLRPESVQIWSPFDLIPMKVIPMKPDGQPDLLQIHQELLAIKQKFPGEKKCIFVPFGAMSYDAIVSVMDSVRTVEKTDPPLYAKDKAGNDVEVQDLFPEIIFGNILGDVEG